MTRKEEGIAVADIGSELAQARERRALSVAELARRTKIPEATIRAIERNDASGSPGGIYTRGFLRAYAREVGCDPEQIVDRYLAQSGTQPVESTETPGVLTALIKARRESSPLHSAEIDAMDRRRSRTQAAGTVVLLLGGLLYLSANRDVRPSQASSDPPAVTAPHPRPRPQPLAEAAPPPAVVGTTGPSSGQTPIEPIDKESRLLRLSMQFRGPCWLTATADGQRLTYRLLNAGEAIQIEAREDVVLRVGDASTLELTINGMAARPLGQAGQAVTVHLTPQNYQQLF